MLHEYVLSPLFLWGVQIPFLAVAIGFFAKSKGRAIWLSVLMVVCVASADAWYHGSFYPHHGTIQRMTSAYMSRPDVHLLHWIWWELIMGSIKAGLLGALGYWLGGWVFKRPIQS